MTKYILTPEQSHRLVDEASFLDRPGLNRIRNHWYINHATTMRQGISVRFSVVGKRTKCAMYRADFTEPLCALVTSKARAYLAANGIKAEVEV